MNKYLFFIVYLLLCLGAWAQQPAQAEYPYRRDIEKGKYDKAAEKILRHVDRDPNSLELHYAAFQIYAHSGFPGCNFDSAYTHLLQVRTIYNRAEAKLLDRWSRDSYSSALIDYDMLQLCRQALRRADSIRTPDAYQHFLSYYALASDALRDSAIASRDTLEFGLARQSGALDMVQAFILRRPSSLLVADAMRLRDSLAFADADRQHTTAAYDLFRNAYPRSDLYQRATDSVYAIDFRDCLLHNGEQYYRSYASRYPQSPFAPLAVWNADSIEYYREVDTANWQSVIQYLDRHARRGWQDSALHKLAFYALRHHHVAAASQVATRLAPGSHDHSLIAHFLHQAYLSQSVNNYPRFYAQFPNLMSAQQRQRDSLAFVLNQYYQPSLADSCIRAIAPCHEAYQMLLDLIRPDIDRGRFGQAQATAESYATYFADDYNYQRLLTTLATQSSSRSDAVGLPFQVNSPKGNEYLPYPTADQQTIYFTAEGRTDNIGRMDVYSARRKGKGWGMATLEMELSHTYGDERVLSVSPDGNRLLLDHGGVLHVAQRQSDGWLLSKVDIPLAENQQLVDVSLSANGRVLMLALVSATERELDPSLNLYVSHLSQEGDWQTPIELGSVVNTSFSECQPFLHPDMRTLYFVSNAHGAMGGADLFMTTRLDDSWTRWSTPVNVRRQIQGSASDQHFVVSADGQRCYFSRQSSGSSDIFVQDLPVSVRPQPLATISGTVRDCQGKPVDCTLYCEDPVTGQVLCQCQTDPVQGTYTMLLPLGRRYSIYVHHVDYFPTSFQVDFTDQQQRLSVTQDFSLTLLDVMTEQGQTAVLKGVSFDVANAQFSVTSQAELKRLARLVRENHYRVEISCHVEGNVGDADNLALTQLRANSLRDYLVEQGCRPADISARGYGSDRPLTVSNQVSSATAKPQSRRVEVLLAE